MSLPDAHAVDVELERLVTEDDRLRREAGADYGNAAALRRMAAGSRRAGRNEAAGVLERAAAVEPEAGDADVLRRMLAVGEGRGAGPRIAPVRSRSALRWALRRIEANGTRERAARA